MSLLFGAAVLMTIMVTLFFPWLQMSALAEQAMLFQAKRVASSAYQAVDLQVPSWARAREQLGRQWNSIASDLELPAEKPRLIQSSDSCGLGFQLDALEQLRDNPDQRYYWRSQREGEVFRFAMAIRHSEVDPHPQVLRGIIDVRLDMPHASTVWNSIVTVLAGASGAVLAIIVFYMVTQRLVLTPVQALRKIAEKVATGDLTVRSSIVSNDEFEDLSSAFNEMLSHLNEAHVEQEKVNRSLDIRLGELAETNVGLFESNRLKSEFLANVTHELRTPLVSIIGFAELLRDSADSARGDPTRQVRYCQNILTSARSLLYIINDLLDLAKIEAGKLEIHVTEFTLDELCGDMIDFVRPLADKREQQLRLDVAADLPRCASDVGKIKQVLYNLLSNAIKFTPKQGRIMLQAEDGAGERFRLIVSDTGPGIPEDERSIVFEKFQQLDSSKSREYEGTGLGLAITKELVHVLGGTICLESQDGVGATFVVELPSSLEQEAASQPDIQVT